ncbi:MAG: hypothetical protein ACPLKP_01810 [Microgenomates group bacterium]
MRGTTHIGYLTYAKDFLSSFKIINEKCPNITEKTNVKYFLLFHSMELAFKSFLLYRGYKVDEIKKLKHDLVKAIDLCKKEGILNLYKLDNQFLKSISHMNEYYRTKQFEYLFGGFKIYIPPEEFIEPINKLLNCLENKYRHK